MVSADPVDTEPSRQSAERVGPLAAINNQPYQYMVKFLCGWWDDEFYYTHISIHNYTGANVRIWERPALGYLARIPGFPDIPSIGTHVIPRGRVLKFDCVDIWTLSGMANNSHAEGMVHIGVGQRLPVVAVYRSRRDDEKTGSTWDWGPDTEVTEYQPFIEP